MIVARRQADISRMRFLLRATDRESRHRLAARSTGNAYDREERPRRRCGRVRGRHPANCVTQYVDPPRQQIRTAVEQVHRKEEGSARNPIAAIIRHAGSMPELSIRRNALPLFRPTPLLRRRSLPRRTFDYRGPRLGDHDRRGVGIGRADHRHHRGVDDPQPVE